MIHLTDETKNQERIEVIRNSCVEGMFEKTNAGLDEAFEYVQDLKDCYEDEEDEYQVYLFNPLTSWATDLSQDLYYTEWD